MTRMHRRTVLLTLAGAAVVTARPALAQIKNGDNPDASPVWQKVRASLFGDKPITSPADDLIELEAPVRAEDAAIVPVAIRTRFPQKADRYVEKVWLIIDNNPSPISAIFNFTPASGRADVETRVRVDEYTHMRAIAQTNDGKLYMTTRFVKASGGCSAPPGKDQASALATLGKMRFKVEGEVKANQPALAQLMISHPNNSGLAMDQLTRQYTPAHFVRRVNVTYGGKPVMSADLDFSISENPNLRFYFMTNGKADGELKVDVVDSNDLKFETSLKLASPA
jgi:sulfur-oxidizing protein SoxY